MYEPYTYLIGWSDQNKWYYGCEYSQVSKIANPNNLWKHYFTSSKIVSQFRKKYGEPDIIKVHRTFSLAEEALGLEERFLLWIDAANNPNWLNEQNGGKNFVNTSGSPCSLEKAKKISESLLGRIGPNKNRKFSNKWRTAMSKTRKERMKIGLIISPTQDVGHTKEAKEKMRIARLNAPKYPCYNCGKVMDVANLNRWHGNNCKVKAA